MLLCAVVIGAGQLTQGRVCLDFIVIGAFYGTVIFYFYGRIFHLFGVISAAIFQTRCVSDLSLARLKLFIDLYFPSLEFLKRTSSDSLLQRGFGALI